MKTDIDRRVASIAPDAGPGMTPGALELMEEITTGMACVPATGPRAPAHRRSLRLPRRRRTGSGQEPGSPQGSPRSLRRLRILAPLAAAIVLLTWFLPDAAGLGPHPASAALDITRIGPNYLITVKDLFADPQRYEREFKAVHLNISLRLKPATPSLEGVIMTLNNDITALERPGGCGFARLRGCEIGIRVPVDFKGSAHIVLGRRARPGEFYAARASLAAEGEPLHCVGFVNQHLPAVLRMLRERGVPGAELVTYHGGRSSVPDSWYVHDGVMSKPGTALILVDPAPRPNSVVTLENYCPESS
ncbi:hypothetical protein [Sphaerisporangium perillae]|uniref:hypothetical protein n=1 Tax=Sphaerisporangium perillae TaxID=2935860 RepID=UPI0020104728|nr:hypothetical protein [Sphaerisporangium perillae]